MVVYHSIIHTAVNHMGELHLVRFICEQTVMKSASHILIYVLEVIKSTYSRGISLDRIAQELSLFADTNFKIATIMADVY